MARNSDISFEQAIQVTEAALSEVNHLAMEQIRRGAEITSHVEAAERELRGALRQLVLAERDTRQLANRNASQAAHERPS